MGSIGVLVKQIPEPTSEMKLDEDFRFVRDGKIILDYADLFGVELALQLKEKMDAQEVVLFSMTPDGQTSGVRTALAMGADRAVIISDSQLANSHSLATAKVLNAAIDHSGDFPLVIAGVESSDGYSGTLPAQLGALRGASTLTFATTVDIKDGEITIKRQSNDGIDVVASQLPAVISVTAGVIEPRYPNFKGIMAAKSKPCDVLSLSDLGVDVNGLAISSQRVIALEDAPRRQSGTLINDQEIAVNEIIEYLKSQGVLS